MKKSCPEKNCSNPSKTVKNGYFFRKCTRERVQCYKCKSCGKKFSQATGSLHFGTSRRDINSDVYKDLCSGVSQRRIALKHNISRGTVARRLIIFAMRAFRRHQKKLKKLKLKNIQFDDLITFEHTKLKQLSISVAVDAESRMILGAVVSRIPASGHLAAKSLKKYGPRPNEHRAGLEKLFQNIAPVISECILVSSDQHKLYPCIVKKYTPLARHYRYKGRRAAVVGQGELKALGKDPLFTINHTAATLRDNIKRLTRKTWCTTKKVENLQHHLNLFIDYFNSNHLA